MQRKLYCIATMVLRRTENGETEYVLESQGVTTPASIKKVREDELRELKWKYPENEGWHTHVVEIAEVPLSVAEELVEQSRAPKRPHPFDVIEAGVEKFKREQGMS